MRKAVGCWQLAVGRKVAVRRACADRGSHVKMRSGLSLTEVLISMFVLLIGLMGVAAMFPVGSHYMVKGDQHDRASVLAMSSASEMVSRGLLSPPAWRNVLGQPLIDPNEQYVGIVIDPMGVAEGLEQNVQQQVAFFPRDDQAPTPQRPRPIRVSVPDITSSGPSVLSKQVARLIFESRDDLAFDLPAAGDRPARQFFDDDLAGSPLRRQWRGEYSWLVTIGPRYDSFGKLVTGREPRLEHHVSVVVFHKRNFAFPGPGETEPNERVVAAEILSTGLDGGEIQLATTDPTELNGMRQGEWIMLFHGHPLNSGAIQPRWFLAWYRIVAMDLAFEYEGSPEAVQAGTRIISLKGPAWPWNPGDVVQAGLVSGVVAVHSKTMRLESKSPWSIPDPTDIGTPPP